MVSRASEVSLSEKNKIVVRPVVNFSERTSAWALVYKKYREMGFIPFNPSGLHFSLIDLLPQNITFVAYFRGRLVGTLSVVFYSAAGLPCGREYDPDLQTLGIDGQVLCEFSKLAQDDSLGLGTKIAMEMGASALLWCVKNAVDDFFCVCHPRHAAVWSSTFGLKPVGTVKAHPGVNDNPGILMHFNLAQRCRIESYPPRGKKYLEKLLSTDKIEESRHRISGCEATMLLLQRPEVLMNAPLHTKVLFEKHYPFAFQTLQPYLRLASGSSGNSRPVPLFKPDRERVFRFANRIFFSDPPATSGLSHELLDHLLIPDKPLVMFISEAKPYAEIKHRVLRSDELILITPDTVERAFQLIQTNIFDLVLISGSITSEILSHLVDLTRERDNLLNLHTPIVQIKSKPGSARDLVFFAEEDLLNEINMLKLLRSIINEVTTQQVEEQTQTDVVGNLG